MVIKNNIGQIDKIQDQSGESRIIEYDFKGNPLTSEKQYCVDYQSNIDWSQSCLPKPSQIANNKSVSSDYFIVIFLTTTLFPCNTFTI